MATTQLPATQHPRALRDIDGGWDGFTWLNVDDAPMRSAIVLPAGTQRAELPVPPGSLCVCSFTPVRAMKILSIGPPEAR
ncbi:MAG: hypothetical protein ACLSHG_01590 [Oscillospiraceae bacterium]